MQTLSYFLYGRRQKRDGVSGCDIRGEDWGEEKEQERDNRSEKTEKERERERSKNTVRNTVKDFWKAVVDRNA